MLKNYRKTKILATIGPSSEKISKIEKLALAGADAFRINSSHSNRDKITQYVKNIRKVDSMLELCHLENKFVRLFYRGFLF